MLGLERGLVKLEPYNNKWSKLFDEERELLSSQLRNLSSQLNMWEVRLLRASLLNQLLILQLVLAL
ncbi:hypothetical protein PQ796_04060 (plasmid) [Priestia megaterium]|uniref:hypothetical protein n=1 Tax=Priestia TaxID=2800373 RepID=UPI0015CF714B|nr:MULTISPECIES: hypothetical protein [Priestia]MDH6651175.1 hypothetical protein [Bacillus sp. PvP124]MDP9580113.1 hypothetical protein [Bacillus sp. 1751]MBV6738825.1 hypothetical protein [Priestia megaterium]MDH2363228.1 hypothetical protein [Priestia megaterium]MDH2449727.1 hypothetical protein [Priestia megaterium]